MGRTAGHNGSNKRIKRSDAPEEISAQVPEETEEMEEGSESDNDEDDYEEEELGSDVGSDEEEKEEDLAHMFYFFAKSQLETGEVKCFAKALAALNKVKNMVMQRNDDLRNLIIKALKRDPSDTRVPPGSGLVQRTLTDERFLMCISNVLICKIQLAKGETKDAMKSLREALIWFPRCIEANYLMAEILRSHAENATQLQVMEAHLSKAIETGNHLRQKVRESKSATKLLKGSSLKRAGAADIAEEDNEFTEADMVMEIEAEELVAAKKAQEIYLLVLCQNGRFTEAYPLLQTQGFKWRLSKEVLNYPLNTSEPAVQAPVVAGTGSEIVRAFDNAMSAPIVSHLQHVFRPESPYWSEHNYDTAINASSTAGYFSYLFPFRERAAVSSIEHVIQQHIYPAVCEQFPQAAEANYAEWWVHSRPHSNGHQLHFDSDETRIMAGRAPAHPIVSTVLYLQDAAVESSVGGPTVVTNQRLAGPLATEGFMVAPKTNRMVMFDAQYLHGVVPGRGLGPSPHTNQRRLTFMVGFWKEIAAKDRGLDTAGPGQPFPDASRTKYTWPAEMPLASVAESTVSSAAAMTPILPLHLSAVWEPIESGVEGDVGQAAKLRSVPSSVAETPHYSTCFQGF